MAKSRNNGVKVEGLKELQREIRKLGDKDLAAQLKKANKEAAELVADAAQDTVPRRSGRLAATIRAAGQAKAGVVRAGKASVPYANAIHWGYRARNISPQPFLYEAQDKRRAEVIRFYEEAMDDLASKF